MLVVQKTVVQFGERLSNRRHGLDFDAQAARRDYLGHVPMKRSRLRRGACCSTPFGSLADR